jgi:hypothetical protein
MRRVHFHIGDEAVDGALLATQFKEAAFFLESFQLRQPSAAVGYDLFPHAIQSVTITAGTDAELQALISAVINEEHMTVTEAYLYVSATTTRPGTHTVDITSGLGAGGTTLAWEYTVGAPNATRYFWVEVRDDNSNSTISTMKTYTTEDNTDPVVTSATMALGTPPTSSIDLSFAATDNDTVQTLYVWVSDAQTTEPTAAMIKASGSALPGNSTSFTVGGLTPNTEYYAWILAKDAAGNESGVYGFTPASLTTNADTVAPSIDSFSVTSGTDPETQVSINLTLSDTL